MQGRAEFNQRNPLIDYDAIVSCLALSDEGLIYVGSAFVTLPRDERDAFWEATELLKVAKPAVKDIRRAKVSFLRPKLRVRARPCAARACCGMRVWWGCSTPPLLLRCKPAREL